MPLQVVSDACQYQRVAFRSGKAQVLAGIEVPVPPKDPVSARLGTIGGSSRILAPNANLLSPGTYLLAATLAALSSGSHSKPWLE